MPLGDPLHVDTYTGRADANRGDGASILAPQRYWDDVKEGDDVPGFTLAIDWTRIALQVSGSQDYYPVHHDPQFARTGGHQEMFINTGFYQSCFARLLTSYAGEHGWVKKFGMQMRRMNYLGDRVTWKGKVVRKYVNEQGEHCLDLDVWAENPRDGVTTPAQATVMLPTRTGTR